MNRNDLIDRINHCTHEIAWLRDIMTNCTGCEHFNKDEAAPLCSVHGPIPADFVTQGCDQWSYDDVPF